MKFHPSITAARVCDACERASTTLDNPGFCIACGADAEGVEPDARDYTCEACGAMPSTGGRTPNVARVI